MFTVTVVMNFIFYIPVTDLDKSVISLGLNNLILTRYSGWAKLSVMPFLARKANVSMTIRQGMYGLKDLLHKFSSVIFTGSLPTIKNNAL